MVECQKCLDPTSLGLFLVAVVSLPLGLINLFDMEDVGFADAKMFFVLIGVLILFVAYFAYKTDSNFGFVVFGLVGAAVALTGYGMGAWENIVFGIVFILAIIWSIFAKTPKNLTLILLTTALLFISVGLNEPLGLTDIDMQIAIGLFALLNGIFAVYLAFALALDNKLPVF